jgi:hypothetical protein
VVSGYAESLRAFPSLSESDRILAPMGGHWWVVSPWNHPHHAAWDVSIWHACSVSGFFPSKRMAPLVRGETLTNGAIHSVGLASVADGIPERVVGFVVVAHVDPTIGADVDG